MRQFNEVSISTIKKHFVLSTESKTGIAWKKNKHEAGTILPNGYCQVRIPSSGNLFVYCHRIVWMLANDKDIPEGYTVDHRDNRRNNNNPENLRLATHIQNLANREHNLIKATGLPSNIFKNKQGYFAKVAFNSTVYRSGEHSSIELAQQWLQNKRRELHGSFYKEV